jgi:hypothetical protein
MSNETLTIAFTVEQSPEEAFAAITSVRDWWSGEIDGSTDQLGAVFTYRYQDVHRSAQRITELVPRRAQPDGSLTAIPAAHHASWDGLARAARSCSPKAGVPWVDK